MKTLKPELIWKYFYEICQVPRPSKKEEKIIKYLLDFGKQHKLETKKDAKGNVLICKPATKKYEGLQSVILQSHMDMVCESLHGVKYNQDKDPIIPVIEGDWMKAKGTTLGADDGIGMAAQLALLASNDVEHGPIECLFTVDEETGLTGAKALQKGFLKGNILLNLDSEDEGEIFIGCAGGYDTTATFDLKKEKLPAGYSTFTLSVLGLKGGHSGDEIHKGLGNSIKIMNRFLWHTIFTLKGKISSIDAGNKRNAIPREAIVSLSVPDKNVKALQDFFTKFEKEIKFENKVVEPALILKLEKAKKAAFVIDGKTADKLVKALYACPHGVIAMSQDIPGLVETSTNLASVKMVKNQIVVATSQRSSVESSKYDIANMVESVFMLAGAKAKHSDGYPGWAPNTKSEILAISKASYKKLFKKEPVIRAIHAGLECGLFLEKYPTLDMISIGPTLRGVHTPDEKIEIPTVQKFWDLMLDILKNIPKA